MRLGVEQVWARIGGWLDPSGKRWSPEGGGEDEGGIPGSRIVVVLLLGLAAIYFTLALLM